MRRCDCSGQALARRREAGRRKQGRNETFDRKRPSRVIGELCSRNLELLHRVRLHAMFLPFVKARHASRLQFRPRQRALATRCPRHRHQRRQLMQRFQSKKFHRESSSVDLAASYSAADHLSLHSLIFPQRFQHVQRARSIATRKIPCQVREIQTQTSCVLAKRLAQPKMNSGVRSSDKQASYWTKSSAQSSSRAKTFISAMFSSTVRPEIATQCRTRCKRAVRSCCARSS